MPTSERRGPGGIWLLAGVLLTIVLIGIGWRVLPLLGQRAGAIGDGQNLASYGFDLSAARLPTSDIIASGLAKDELRALDSPPAMTVSGLAEFHEEHRGKYLVSDDRVIGVVIDGQARAYPIRVLNWHEIVNDTLAGQPIAVTYHPLCDSVVVFDRRISGEVLNFGVSGLLLDSNLLMFDRRAGGVGESLWSQLRAQAVTGPAARDLQELRVLPVSVASWQDWVAAHPQTTVLQPDVARFELYRRAPYGNYFAAGKLRYPVDPSPPENGLAPMTRVLVIRDATRQQLFPLNPEGLHNLATSARALGASVQIADREPPTEGADPPPSFVIEPGPGVQTIQSFWFAWYASHPDTATAALKAAVPRSGQPQDALPVAP